MYVVLEKTPEHKSFFCSLPNKYSCLLQVLWVACGIKENNSKNKLVGISKLNFALSFSQLESLDKVSWLLPNGKAKYSKGGCVCSELCGKPGFPFLHVSFPQELKRTLQCDAPAVCLRWPACPASHSPALQCLPAGGHMLVLSLEQYFMHCDFL